MSASRARTARSHAFAMPSPFQRRATVVATVIGLHVAALWALQAGLLRRVIDTASTKPLMVALIEPAVPVAPPPPSPPPPAPPPPAPPRAAPKPPPRPQAPAPAPAPALSLPSPPPAATPAAPALPAATAAPAAPAPPEPAPVELPSSSAAYLNNPRPAYPPLSRRLGEQGRVVVRVLIEADGTASRAEIQTSSGYERLDQTALQTVLRWRYVPGKRAGVAEAMWFNVPIQFVLE